MIKHIVMWQLKERALENTKEKNAMMLKIELESLIHKIKEIKHIEVGLNFSTRENAFDACLYTEFKTKKDLNIYAIHPDHLKVKEFISKISSNSNIIDYEVN